MKIVVLQDFLRSGGTERQSILLANAFADASHDATLLTFRPGGALERTVSPQVTRRALQPFDLHLDWFAPGLAAAIRRAAPNVILCMGRMANGYAGRIQRRFPGTAVIATMRTGRTLPAPFRRSLSSVRHIVANSHAARDTLIRHHGVPGEKISVIHNALVFPGAADPNAAARTSLRAQHGASPETLVLLCVAMFRPEKNQRVLIDTVAELPPKLDWQLWLAGDGPARPACEQRVATLGLGARIKFVGFHRDPSPLYAAADVAVHASHTEALSNFIIEAQAHGLPAIVHEAQGMDECLIPGETGWICPPVDAAAFRAAIVRFIQEPPAARAERAAAARKFARERFDPRRQVSTYLALFQTLAAEPTKPLMHADGR